MTHAEWTGKLDAYLDGEMPSVEAQELDRHLRGCSECAAESLRRVQWKRAIHSSGMRYTPDAAYRERVRKSVAVKPKTRPLWVRWPSLALSAAVLALVFGGILFQRNAQLARNDRIVGELADLHVATLASANPVDVVSTDRHTVKPWFTGKIPFSFNLPELQGTQFELLGGRVSYLEQSPGAELIFRVRKHQVSVFIFQDRAAESFPSAANMDARSFHLETWEKNGLRYFVLGDVAPEDIHGLSELMKQA
jgi:anti-sigma factor RsiW